VPFTRPAEAATDTATDLQVFRHALLFLQDQGYRPDLVVHLRPTGPVRKLQLIEHAIALMLGHPEADSLRSVGLAEQTPYKMWRIEGSYLRQALELPGFPESHSMPRQKLPLVYHQNGYVDIVRPRAILEMDSMVGRTVLPFVVEGKIHELDYPEQIPALTLAVERAERGDFEPEAAEGRHSA
jgi:CMP-N-acetylneuraminic acid synthetase